MPKPIPYSAAKDELLFDATHALRNEIGELRDAITELREEIQWGNRNCGGYLPSHFQLDRRDDDESELIEPEPSEELSHCNESLTNGRDAEMPPRQESLW